MDREQLRITARERQALLEQYRKGAHERVRLRAHIILLLAEGWSWAMIAGVLFCSTRTIARWKNRVEAEGMTAVFGPSPVSVGLGSRWSCQVMMLVLLETYELRVSQETVRRWLHKEQIVWRRPRPTVEPTDPQHDEKLRALRQLLATLPVNEIAVFQDE